LGLVCALPDQAAREKLLLMLRLYVDDSGKVGDSPVQVLAGYLASTERWAAFSNEWHKLISGAGLELFRMADAWRLSGQYQFNGPSALRPLRRNNLLVQLIECIKDHVEMAFVSSVSFSRHQYYANPFPDQNLPEFRPYYFGFFALLADVYRYAFHKRANQRLEVIFDEQGGESQKFILSGMDEFRRVAAPEYPDLIIPTPQFQRDTDALPLQASDMLAWLVSRDARNLRNGIDRSKTLESVLLGEALSMPNSVVVWNESKFRHFSEVASARLLSNLKIGAGAFDNLI
jgi:hypothetical protein